MKKRQKGCESFITSRQRTSTGKARASLLPAYVRGQPYMQVPENVDWQIYIIYCRQVALTERFSEQLSIEP